MTFSERMQDLMAKSVEASREIVSKASAQAQTWGEMGMLKIEILQLRNQAEKLTASLGALAYAALAERGESSIRATDPDVAELLKRIGNLERDIDERERRYRSLGGKDADLGQDI